MAKIYLYTKSPVVITGGIKTQRPNRLYKRDYKRGGTLKSVLFKRGFFYGYNNRWL